MTKKLFLLAIVLVFGLASCGIAPELTGVEDNLGQRTATTYVETFDSCTVGGTSYVNGSFKGVGGFTWNYVSIAWAGGDISGKTPVLAKGKSPAASLSTTVNNGVGTIKFRIKKPYTTAVNLQLKINGAVVATVTHSATTIVTKGPFTVNKSGSVKIELVQATTGAGQVSIDDITWTSYGSTGGTTPSSSSSKPASSAAPPAGGTTTFTETFESCTASGTSYASGNFKGVGGFTWNYVGTAWAGGTITGAKTPVLGKGRNPAASLSATVTGGVGTIKFKVKKPYASAVKLKVMVGGSEVAIVEHSAEAVKTFGPFTVNKPGSVKIEFVQPTTAAGQVAIDDVTWTSYGGSATPSSSSSKPASSTPPTSSTPPSGGTSYLETFETSPGSGTTYVNGSFKGVGGFTWTYYKTAWAGGIDGKTPVLAKNGDLAYLTTTVNNGVGEIEFKIKKPYATKVNLLLRINGATIRQIELSETGPKGFGPFNVNKAGSVKIEFIQAAAGSGQVAIDDVKWTSYTAVASSSSSVPASSGFTENMSLPKAVRDYYRAAYGKTGNSLKTELKRIISAGYVDKGYNYLWTMYKTSDVTPSGRVWDLYSNTDNNGTGKTAAYWYTMTTSQCGQYKVESDCYNREHMIPQSYFGKKAPMVSDAHHVTAVDGKVNGMRSDYPHANVATATWVSQNGSRLGSGTSAQGYTKTCFEPRADAKGDIARIYFYFSLRYDGNANCKAWDAMGAGAKLKPWTQTLYRAWSKADPVSNKEKNRNNAIYAVQKNRNPFIDYPELADMIDFTK